MAVIRAIIVDDEDSARRRLRNLLAAEPDLEVVGECQDGEEAIVAIRQLRPDLVFLDVRMPGLDGLDVLEMLGSELPPAVVFATAYDDYAVRAFEARAVDYLLKPFSVARLKETIRRVRDRLEARPTRVAAASWLRVLQEELRPRRITLRSGGTAVFLEEDEIDRIEGEGNYIRVHARGQTILLRETLKGILKLLPGQGFVRIHNSHIVNLRHVREVEPTSHGEYVVRLIDGTRLPASRTYAGELRARLGL